MKKYFFLILGLVVTTVFGQQPQTNGRPPLKKIKLTGTVIDQETQEVLEYATISLVNEGFPDRIQGGITDSKGNFDLEIFPGKYNVTIEYIGFDKITFNGKVLRDNENLGTIALKIAAESLDEIELVGERTEVEIRLDKRIYNVGKDITVRGGSVADVLDNVPSVSVDVEGNIALRGNENVRILINGKPSGLVGLSGPQGLRSLPAESIEKVEVVTSPSARYEASGTAGILNIILKKEELEGFNGSFVVNGGFPTSYGGNVSLNWRTKKVNLFSTTSLRDSESRGGGIFESENFVPLRFVNEDREYIRNRKSVFFNLGAEYYFNENTSLTVSGFLRRSDNESDNSTEIKNLNADGLVIDEFGRYQFEEELDNSQQFTANFTKKFDDKGHELVIEFQTESSTEDQNDVAENTSTFNQESESLENQKRTLLQMDYVWPIDENTQFELGYRGDFSFQETDYNVFDLLDIGRTSNVQLTNFLGFTQNINAAYTQFGQKVNKFSYLMGLRMEKTHIEIDQKTINVFKEKDYTDWFPTLNLSYEFNEKENLTLGYSRRVSRPRSWSLNPFRSLTSLTFFRQGNPDLDPSYSNLFDLGYLKRWEKFTFNGSVYLQRATQVIERITEATGELVVVSQDPLVELPEFRSTSINLSENTRTGTEFTLTYSPKRRVRISGNFNLFNSETVGTYNGTVLDRDIVSWFARLNSSFPLPFGINTQLRGFYFGPRANAQTESKGVFTLSGALNKSLFNKKGELSFRVSDILNSSRRKSTTETAEFRNYSEFQWRQPSYVFTFTYRINERKMDRKRNRNQSFDGGDDGGGPDF
ncbi:TonB-dependent receptor [Flavobacteriaceae bacterium]|nr:TonB-dependent receptor [Flavobacteriaceae bacterium]MDA9851372.1 TonB-dependent receptor [Flavobacteriaceae bacterium]